MIIKIIIAIVIYFVVGSLIFSDFMAWICSQKFIIKAFPIWVKDLYLNIKNREYKHFKRSGIVMYGGLFGTGKTFNIVDYVCNIYKHYDNVEVYSNVTFNTIPFTEFKYFEDLCEPVPEGKFRIFVCDEFGSLFNSRNYKDTKLTETQYTTVLNQLRKENKLLLISTQRYGMVDKMFRQVCMEWCECHKLWRFMWFYRYDPFDLEYSYDPRIVKPLSILPTVTFATDKKRNQYNTHEFVRDFENPIEITDRLDTNSGVNADFQYSRRSRKSIVHRGNR